MGELTRMRASDFSRETGTIAVRESKAGKPRHVALTHEGQHLFAALTAGKTGRDPIFVRNDGATWGPSHQQRPLDAASKRTKITPAATFHILRQSYASARAMRGVPMGVNLPHLPGGNGARCGYQADDRAFQRQGAAMRTSRRIVESAERCALKADNSRGRQR